MRFGFRHLTTTVLLAQAAVLVSSVAFATVPQGLTEQGRLYDSTGNPLNATVSLTFSLYGAASGGTAVWTETQASVTLDQGYFSVELGSVTPIPQSAWTGATLYVGLAVNSDPEMTPRQPTYSVPYALVTNDAVGAIHPATISVNGTLIVDAAGDWVGPSSGLIGPTGPAGAGGATGAAGATGAIGAQGLTGAAGPAGSAGPQGPQGPLGATGAQGAAGATGASGAQGLTGANGADGAAGVEGATGATGATGPSGAQGPAGPGGPQGPAGATGAAGAQGAAGSNGAQGPAGSDGAAGAQGPQGPAGADGATGPTGAQGPQGPGGPQGPAGATGAAGAQGAAGSNGAQGANGATGAQGAQGAAGSDGATGANGVTGATGATGPTGAQGPQGPTGAAGSNGAQGAAGTNGSNGAQGAAGTNGSNGAQGAAGTNGSNGAQGAAGTNGSNGAQGAAGTAGSSGAQGAAGSSGSNGAQGATGSSGAQGATGSTGAQGATGSSGAQGATGSSGAQGATGSSGAQGTAGSSGAQGAAGSNGSNGAPGAAGSNGAQGAAGTAGAQGAIGPQGSTGATGSAGATGAAGATGPVGPTGPTGSSLWSTSGSTVYYTGGNVGVGTSTPASTLQVGGSFAENINPTAVTAASYPVASTDSVLRINATSNPVTATLPSAVGIPGRHYVIKKVDTSTNGVTISTTGGQTIDGSATTVLFSQYQYASLISDGANWAVIGGTSPRGLSSTYPAVSCLDALNSGATASGAYWINPGGTPFQAYCDMVNNGGGWTLIMRMASSSTFIYSSAYWTNQTTLNPSDLLPSDNTDGKFASFYQTNASTLMGCNGASSSCQTIALGASQTAYTLFNGAGLQSTTNGGYLSRASMVATFPPDDPSEPNCDENGINVAVGTSGDDAYARFGLIGNNEANCGTPDSAWGWGIAETAVSESCGAGSVDWNSGSGGVHCAQATLWVR